MKMITTLIFLLSALQCFSQTEMVIDEKGNVSTYYEGYAKTFNSLSNVPDKIKKYLDILLRNSFGEFHSSLKFVDVQILDQDTYFKNNDISRMQWIVPKYEFHYYLVNPTIGVNRYNVNIRMDRYGQLIKMNWPKTGYNKLSDIQPRAKILAFALENATRLGFETKGYLIDFGFKDDGTMLWNFRFPKNDGSDQYHCFSIPWHRLSISEVGQSIQR